MENVLDRQTRHMSRLIEGVLDFSRLGHGKVQPNKQRVDLGQLIEVVIEAVRPCVEERGHELAVALPPCRVVLEADPTRLAEVLTNLLENAARYSGPGRDIMVSASRWHDMVEVRVADRGPGIAAPDRERVFDEFYRRDVGPQRGGTGLGLAIARAVVTGHGGSIWIEDTPGGGATVGFRLPLHRERAAAARP